MLFIVLRFFVILTTSCCSRSLWRIDAVTISFLISLTTYNTTRFTLTKIWPRTPFWVNRTWRWGRLLFRAYALMANFTIFSTSCSWIQGELKFKIHSCLYQLLLLLDDNYSKIICRITYMLFKILLNFHSIDSF